MSKKSTKIIVSSIVLGGLLGIGATTWYYLCKKNKGMCSCSSLFDCKEDEENGEEKKEDKKS